MTTISDKTSEFYWDDVWNGKRPSKVFVTFVKQSAVNGGYADNPFYFEHFDLSEIVLYVNGEPTPIRPMKLDFGENNNYVTPLKGCSKTRASSSIEKHLGLDMPYMPLTSYQLISEMGI